MGCPDVDLVDVESDSNVTVISGFLKTETPKDRTVKNSNDVIDGWKWKCLRLGLGITEQINSILYMLARYGSF